MFKKISCIYAENPGGYCKNKKVKRSLFGIGARCCVKYFKDNPCEYEKKTPKPTFPPPMKPLRN